VEYRCQRRRCGIRPFDTSSIQDHVRSSRLDDYLRPHEASNRGWSIYSWKQCAAQVESRCKHSPVSFWNIHDEYVILQTYFCGPGALAKAVKEATEHHTCATVDFSFAKVRTSFQTRFLCSNFLPGTFLILPVSGCCDLFRRGCPILFT
jgi:hypothetical protein